MAEGNFPPRKKGESRYEETIPDRSTTGGATVPPDGPRTESRHPDDLSHGWSRGTSARRRGSLAAGGGIGFDAPGDGRRSAISGGGAASAAPRAPRPSLGERRRLLRGGRAEGSDSPNAVAPSGPSRAAAGQLRVVPAQRAAGAVGVGQDDARVVDAELRGGGERF